jgi:nucleotide-binding universal stress UspA family protein
MFKDILVCLEGSPSSEAATLMAIEIARQQRAILVGMVVVDQPDICAGTPTGIGGSSFKHERDETLLADARAHAADWLAHFERHCAAAGVATGALETVGRPADSIIAEMARHDAIVMGRDVNFRYETQSQDSATRDKILRHTTRPVLLVPPRASAIPALLGKTVLIAYDGSKSSTHALDSFAASGLAEGRAIHVATIGDDGAKAWDVASVAVDKLGSLRIPSTTHNVVSVESPSEALIKLGRQLEAGLLVMGAFAHSRLAELIHGSGTRDVVEHYPMTVYLQH